MSSFQREDRYIIIKRSKLTQQQLNSLLILMGSENIQSVAGVVVEDDWPEHEVVWEMIEDRVLREEGEGDAADQ